MSRFPVVPVLAVVPVLRDDVLAPHGCAALRVLHGRALVSRAVDALLGSGMVGEVVLVAEPGVVEPAVVEALGGCLPPRVRLVPLVGEGVAEAVLAALAPSGQGLGVAPITVLHDPLHALIPEGTVRAVVEALLGAPPRCAAAVPVRPVTDTLKWVSEGTIVATGDRDRFRSAGSPVAYRTEDLAGALRSGAGTGRGTRGRSSPGAPALVGLSFGLANRVVAVPTVEGPRVATADDLALAEAVVAVGEQDAAIGGSIRAALGPSRPAAVRPPGDPAGR